MVPYVYSGPGSKLKQLQRAVNLEQSQKLRNVFIQEEEYIYI